MSKIPLLLFLLLPMAATALDGRDCRDLLGKMFPSVGKTPGWMFAEVPKFDLDWATLYGLPVPNTARGDFDGDKIEDVAFLVQPVGETGRVVAACISSDPAAAIIVSRGGCLDTILSLPPSAPPDEERSSANRRQDTIATNCSEKSTRLWTFKNGKFVLSEDQGH